MPKKPTLNTLAERLKFCRRRAGLTQGKLAAKLGLGEYGKTVISLYESGKRTPRAGRIVELSKAAKCSVHELMIAVKP